MLAMGGSPARALAGTAVVGESGQKDIPVGIQLYSVREELKKDLPGTLRAVAAMGYEAVEFYAPYFAWTFPCAKQVRELLDDLGLRCYSTHNLYATLIQDESADRAIELNQILGSRAVVFANSLRHAAGVERWKEVCDRFTAMTERFGMHGLAVGLHNHAFEWAPLTPAQRIMDFIAANTPASFMLQLDVGTCLAAGADPVAWIKAHPGRTRSVHLKDWAPGLPEEEKGYRVHFGEGTAPWAEIVAAAESVGGVEWYLMEQEGSRFPEFETARRCLTTWRQLRGRRG